MPFYYQLCSVLQSYTVVVCVIGLFGNVNLVVATCRYRFLRTKMGRNHFYYPQSHRQSAPVGADWDFGG